MYLAKLPETLMVIFCLVLGGVNRVLIFPVIPGKWLVCVDFAFRVTQLQFVNFKKRPSKERTQKPVNDEWR